MKKKRPSNDDWVEEPVILGVGAYHSNGSSGKTKFKHPIGFIRPKVTVKRKVNK